MLGVVDGVERAWGALMGRKGAPPPRIALQALQLPERSAAEAALAKHSMLGLTLVMMAQAGMEAVPFGRPAAALLGAVYVMAAQVRGLCQA